MTINWKAFLANHPEVVKATDALIEAVTKAAEDALEVAIGQLPLVGGLAEKIAAPVLEELGAKADAALEARLNELLNVPLVEQGSGVAGVVSIEEVPKG